MPPCMKAHLPLEPLLRASGCFDAFVLYDHKPVQATYRPWGRVHHQTTGTQPAPVATIAELCGVSGRTATRWGAEGIPINAAEDAAFACGLHPVNVWGDLWLFAAGCPVADTVERVCR
jgi:hypothetical protein